MNNSPEAEQDQLNISLDVRHYVEILRRWWRVIALCAVLGLVLGTLYGFSRQPQFEAKSSLTILRGGNVVAFDPSFRTVSELDPTQSVDQSARRRSLINLATSLEVANRVYAAVKDQLPTALTPDTLLDQVSVTTDGELLVISTRALTPARAALIANTWANETEKLVNQVYADSSLTPQQLAPQLQSAEQDYAAKQSSLQQKLANNPVPGITVEISKTRAILDNQVNESTRKLSDLYIIRAQRDRMLTNARALRARLATANAGELDGANLAALLLEGSAYSTFAELPVDLEVTVPSLTGLDRSAQAAALDSLIQGLQSQQANLDEQIQAETRSLLAAGSGTESSPPPGGASETDLYARINALEAQLEGEQSKLKELGAARDLAWTTFISLTLKMAEINVAAQAPNAVVRIATPAYGTSDGASRVIPNSLLGGVIGLLVGVGLAFLLNSTAAVVSTPRQAKSVLGLPTLAVLEAQGDKAAAQNLEALRALRYQLLAAEPNRTFLFAGVRQRDAVTALVTDLARLSADTGQPVLVVDANLRSSNLAERLGARRAPGLAELLHDASAAPAGMEAAIQQPAQNRLAVVASGNAEGDPTALLERHKLTLLLKHWSEAYPLVLVNAPPILGMIDAVEIAPAADRVVLVVDRAATFADDARRAREVLAEHGIEPLGVVLTQSAAALNLRTRVLQLLRTEPKPA